MIFIVKFRFHSLPSLPKSIQGLETIFALKSGTFCVLNKELSITLIVLMHQFLEKNRKNEHSFIEWLLTIADS